MNRVFLLRLVLDSIAAGLLLFALAYFWKGNASHEMAGTGMFLLIVIHNIFHRRWFVTLAHQQGRARRGRFNMTLTLLLLAGMVVLLTTSLMISETLFPGLRLKEDFLARQIHAGVAYWLLIIVATHLGLRWPLLLAVARTLLRLTKANGLRNAVLRLIAMGIAVQGISSALALNLHYRLQFQMTLDWWNFEESAVGFFGHCMAIVGLCMFVTYYIMKWLGRGVRTVAV